MATKRVAKSIDRLQHVVLSILKSYGGATALGLHLQIESGDWLGAVTHTINPLSYEHPEDFQRAYLAVNLIKKLACVPGVKPEDRAELAKNKYVQCEDELSVSDRRLSALYRGAPSTEPLISDIISMSREKIRSWLGDFDWDEWWAHARFGPGSSSSVRGLDVSIFEKMSKPSVDTTLAFLPILEVLLDHSKWGDHVAEITNREYVDVITVPKTAVTDRTIGIEPDANIFAQLGIGGMMRARLKRAGCDLDNGWLRNADLACKGSIDGSLATVDLSAASDRISYKLVRELLPADWFDALCRVRTPYAKVGEYPFILRKFSSMGNGFTFELESMIFYALTLSCVQLCGSQTENVAVFGDDIVCPTAAVPLLYKSFRFLGFVVNEAKSFHSGYFRESCGAHFFKGRNCKPVYLKEDLTDEVSIYKVANALRRLAFRVFGVDVYYTDLLPSYRCVVSCLGRRPVLRIPDGYGDGGLCSSFDEVVPHLGSSIRRLGSGHEGFLVRSLQPIAKKVRRSDIPGFTGVLFSLDRRKVHHCKRYVTLESFIQENVVVREVLPLAEDGFLCYAPRIEECRYKSRPMVVPHWFDPQ